MTAPKNVPERLLSETAEKERAALYDKLGGFLEDLLVRKFELPREEAALLVAEVFVMYYGLEAPPDDARAWLSMMVCANAQAWLQRRGLPPGNEAEAAREAPRVLSYRDALELLAPHAREALRLRFSEQKTPHQIAAELGVSPDEAEQIVTRAMARMREVLRGKRR